MGQASENSPRSRIELLERRVLFALFGPDVSFADGGIADVEGNLLLEVLPDQKILAVGYQQLPSQGNDDLPTYQSFAHKLNADGTPDASFGDDGVIDFGVDIVEAAVTEARLYVLVGNDDEELPTQLRAYKLSDGTLDTAFSQDGQLDDFGVGLFGASDGGVFVVGTDEIRKYKADGTLDNAFAGDGSLAVPQVLLENVEVFVSSNGILIFEDTAPNETSTVKRYNVNTAAQDMSFGASGTATIPIDLDVEKIIEQPDGKILILEKILDASLTRMNANGSVDSSFGDNGKVDLNAGATFSSFTGVGLDADENILVSGGGTLRRFSPTGVADTSPPFDGTLLPSETSFGADNIVTDAQGRILTGSQSNVTRLDGLDPVQLGRDGVLYLHGDDADDDFLIHQGGGGQYAVNHNGDTTNVPMAGVIGFNFRLHEGNNSAEHVQPIATTVTTGAGNDRITTGDGADSIAAGDGNNVMDIGDGDDTITFGDFGNEATLTTVTGGIGNKSITADGGRMTVNIGVGDHTIITANGDGKNEITIAGGSSNIRIMGDADVLTIGGSGNNTIELGGDGGHVVTTGEGNDSFLIYTSGTINSNGGADVFNVTAHFDQQNPLIINAGDGDDHLEVDLDFTYDHDIVAHGGNGNDYFWGGNGEQKFYGDAGNDTLRGAYSSDLLSGGGGNDRIFGESGNDRIYGGAGRDIIDGGSGNDRIFGHDGGDIIYGGSGNDTVDGGLAGDRLYGQRGNDSLDGGEGDDRLNGGSGTDNLDGDTGDDLLSAKDSEIDTLVGGAGADRSANDSNDSTSAVESTNITLPAAPTPPPLAVSPLSDETEIDNEIATDAAVAANGTFITTGIKSDGNNRTIQATRFGADGAQIGNPIALVTVDVAGDQFGNVDLPFDTAIDQDGDAVLVYRVRQVDDTFDYDDQLFFVRLSNNGVVSEPVLVSEGHINDPRVSMADDGSFFIAWLQEFPSPDLIDQGVQIRSYNADGTAAGPQFEAAEPVNGALQNLVLSTQPDGSGAVFAATNNAEQQLYVRVGRVDRTHRIGSLRDINRDERKSSIRTSNPAVAAHRDGSFILGYMQNEEQYALHFDSSAKAHGPIKFFNKPDAGNFASSVQDLRLTTLRDGGFLAAFRVYNGQANEQTIYTRRYRADDTTNDDALLAVSTTTANANNFGITTIDADDQSNALVLYTHSVFTPESHRILYRRVTTS